MKKQTKLLALAYLAALLAWLLWGGVRLVKTAVYSAQGLYVQSALSYEELAPKSMKRLDDRTDGVWYVSTDSDPQFHWQGEAYLNRVVLRMQRETPGLGVVLYWKAPGQADYAEAKSVYGVKTAPGEYTFELGGKRVSEVRIDPDSVGGVITRFDGVQLNPPAPWYQTFRVSALGLLAFLALPLLAVAVGSELWAICKNFRKEN